MKKWLAVFCLFIINFCGFAQGGFPPPPPPPPPPAGGGPECWPPPCIPIDNGIIFLCIAGVLLVAYKFNFFTKYSNYNKED